MPIRVVLDAVLWVLVTGAPWRSLPQSYPNYKTVHRRYLGWRRSNARRRVLDSLVDELRGARSSRRTWSRPVDPAPGVPPAPAGAQGLRDLASLAADVRPPVDYFRGTSPPPAVQPGNVLVFTRLTRSSMQPRDAFRHRRYALNACVATAGRVALDGRWFRLEPGQCLLVFPHQTHAYADFGAEKLCWMFVTFELAGVPAIESLRNRVIDLSPEGLGRLRELSRCWLDRRGGRTGLIPLTTLLVSDLLAALPREGGGDDVVDAAQPPGAVAGNPGDDRSGQLLPRIHALLESSRPGWRIKALAGRLGLSESRLRAAFRAQTGVSLGRYLREFRINRAAAMLAGTSLRVTEVAERCGFDSLYTFCRAFRRAMGMPARTYRRQATPR